MGLRMKRREFLKAAGAASAAAVTRSALAQNGRSYIIVFDGADPVAGSPAVQWAAEQLRAAIAGKGRLCRILTATERVRNAALYVVVAAPGSALAKGFPNAAGELSGAETFRLVPGRHAGVAAVLVSGSDARGYVYGLLEFAERVRFGSNPAIALHLTKAIEEKPANEFRTRKPLFLQRA